VARGLTTRCCSKAALLACATIALGAQSRPSRAASGAIDSFFPVRTVWTLPLNNPLAVGPAYSGARAFFAIAGGRIAAYDVTSGRQAWIVPASPAFDLTAGGDLLFVAEAHALAALHQVDGSPAWRLPLPAELTVPPVWDNGWLVAATREGDVLAFRATDGHLVWRQRLGSPAHAPPSLAADRVYVPTEDGRILALRVEDGTTVWTRQLGGPATAVLALDEQVFAGSLDNFLYCLDARDGSVSWRWRTGADVIGVPVVDDDSVYFVSYDNVLRALSRGHGVQRWMRLLPLRPTRGPLRAGTTLLVTGVTPMLRGYDIATGAPAGDLTAAGDIAAVYVEAAAGHGGRAASLVPTAMVVTTDIAKGATATLLTRDVEPKMSPLAPLPGPVKPTVRTD
jgi:outer membrane protein assembly factor BamB